MTDREILKELNSQQKKAMSISIPKLLDSLKKTYGDLGKRCLPVAARLLHIELSANPSVESLLDETVQRLVNDQEVLDCYRAVQVANAFDAKSFDEFLKKSWEDIYKIYKNLANLSSIDRNNPELSNRAYIIAEARTFFSTTVAEKAISSLLSENYQFPRVCPVENHFFREVCWKYSEHLNYGGPAVDVLKKVSVKNWRDYLWGHLMLQHKDAIRFLRRREVLLPSVYRDPQNVTAVGEDTDKKSTGEADTDQETEVGGDTDKDTAGEGDTDQETEVGGDTDKETAGEGDTDQETEVGGDTDKETADDPDPFEVNDSTTDQILNEEAFNQLCAEMTPNEKNRCLFQIIAYYLWKTAYFDPDKFQWLKTRLSNSWEKIKSDYDEAQNTLRHEEDSKREARDKNHRLLIQLNQLIKSAYNSEYFTVDEIRRIVFDGRRYLYNKNKAAQGERIAADPLKREILELINLVQRGTGDIGLLENINILSKTRFNGEIRNRPVSALEDRIYHIDVLLPHAETEMQKDLKKEQLELNIKLAAFRHEDSRVHYLKDYGPGLKSNLGRYRLHRKYIVENPGSRSDIIGGVFWIRSDRKIFDILLENGLVTGDYNYNQPTISRSKKPGEELVRLMVPLGMIIQRRLDLFIDITEWNLVELVFGTFLKFNPKYSWHERSEIGYELKTEDQLLNIEWIVGKFRNCNFQLRLTTPEAIQLWMDYRIELSRNNENLEVIADHPSSNQR